jgi:isoleucyl-tRNA synthetase
VHLCEFPAVNEPLIDEELSAAVKLIQFLVSLGRSARAKANIKVRQPLQTAHIFVFSDEQKETVLRLTDQIIDELNVKDVQLIEEESDFFEYQVRPHLPTLGPKYGSELGPLQRALARADKAYVGREARIGHAVEVDSFVLEPNEILVTVSGKPGYAVAEAGYAVAVTTEITPELADEGLARELVRHIQELRKSAGFDIADRIHLGFDGDTDIHRVMSAWRGYIGQETLAEAIVKGTNGGHEESLDIDGHAVQLSLKKL